MARTSRTSKPQPAPKQKTRRGAKPPKDVGELRIEYMPLSEIAVWPGNPKEHDLDGIGESIERHGMVDPLICDEGTGRLAAGHGRREKLLAKKAAGDAPPDRIRVREDGEWLVPVLRGVDFGSAVNAEAYLLGSNRLVEAGGWNMVPLIRMLERHAGDVKGLGWKQGEIDDMVARMKAANGGEVPTVEAPKEFVSFAAGQKKTHACPKCGFAIVCDAK